ncbi:MAG TPA: class I SAM-dependent methyltransferase [Myxococcota bacterium]|nr:class I SAM-dependent methyltransferase [Myxococcota bacterium]
MSGILERIAARLRPRPAVASANPAWDELVAHRNAAIFEPPGDVDFAACRRIDAAFDAVLAQYAIPRDEFYSGSIKERDAAALHALVRKRGPRVAYQVGTFVGYSALVIASALRDQGSGVLVCCDPEIPHRTFLNPVDVARDMARTLGLEAQLRFECGWHAVPIGYDFGRSFVRGIPVRGPALLAELGAIDFAFVDGDHSHTATICDLMVIQERLAVGGVAVFHDAKSWPSVSRALLAFRDDIYFYRESTRAYFDFDTFDGPDGLIAIERRREVRGAVLELRVTDAAGSPVAHADVAIAEAGFAARTGRDGRVFHFAEASAPMRVRVTAPGYLPLDAALGVATRGDHAVCDLHLERAPA